MPQPRVTHTHMRKAQYAMGYEDAKQRGTEMTDLELEMQAARAAYLVQRNYGAGHKLSASKYEGKVAGFREVLQRRRTAREES